MARTKATQSSPATKVDLKNLRPCDRKYPEGNLSSGLKSQAYTGNPAAGSVNSDLATPSKLEL